MFLVLYYWRGRLSQPNGLGKNDVNLLFTACMPPYSMHQASPITSDVKPWTNPENSILRIHAESMLAIVIGGEIKRKASIRNWYADKPVTFEMSWVLGYTFILATFPWAFLRFHLMWRHSYKWRGMKHVTNLQSRLITPMSCAKKQKSRRRKTYEVVLDLGFTSDFLCVKRCLIQCWHF